MACLIDTVNKMANEIVMKNLINIRVLQHEKSYDNIRIGASFKSDNLDDSIQDVIKHYEAKSEWCGGFQRACETYYKRIAIVDADTLEVIHSIYERKEQ